MMAERRAIGTKASAAVVDYVLDQLFSGALRSGIASTMTNCARRSASAGFRSARLS